MPKLTAPKPKINRRLLSFGTTIVQRRSAPWAEATARGRRSPDRGLVRRQRARRAVGRTTACGRSCRFGGQGEAHFDDLGVGLYWLEPGRPMSLYHHEAGQEDFLVLRGDCLLIVEGEERPLGAARPRPLPAARRRTRSSAPATRRRWSSRSAPGREGQRPLSRRSRPRSAMAPASRATPRTPGEAYAGVATTRSAPHRGARARAEGPAALLDAQVAVGVGGRPGSLRRVQPRRLLGAQVQPGGAEVVLATARACARRGSRTSSRAGRAATPARPAPSRRRASAAIAWTASITSQVRCDAERRS